MSGHASFAPIGNNNPQPVINTEIVEDINTDVNFGVNAAEHNDAIADVPQSRDNEPPRAAHLIGQLDILLYNAVQRAAVGVNKVGVTAAATGAGLSQKTISDLAKLAETAQTSIAKLDRFTGRQLAEAMVKTVDDKGKVLVSWVKGNAAAKAIQEAQAAQEKLSSAIAEVLGQASTAETQARLEEIMMQCDRRAAEIDTLVLQMTEIVDNGGDNMLEQVDALAGKGKISAFTSKDALEKFDRNKAFAAMHSVMEPLTARLADYSNGFGKSITEAEVASCKEELDALKTKFSEAATSGVLKVGDKQVFCDRSMLTEAETLLGEVEAKINSMHRDIIRGAMRNLVENSFPFLKHEIFEKRFEADFAKIKFPYHYETPAELASFVNLMNTLRSAARAYVAEPTKANKDALEDAAQVLKDMNREGAAEVLEQELFRTAVPGKGASAEFKAALTKFKQDVAGPKGEALLSKMQKEILRAYTGIDVAVAHLVELAGKLDDAPGGGVYVSSWVLGAFRGEQTVSSIVEARAHGYSDSEIDPKIDDSNVVSSRELGSGAFNTVTLLKLKDGSEWVFKPEMPACLTTAFSTHFHGMSSTMEFTRINVTVQHTADTLGLNDVMVTTKAGTNKGRFGMFMEKAPGLTCNSYLRAAPHSLPKNKLTLPEMRKLDDDKFAKVVGRLMRQSNRLLWFDILTGQGDRHNDNYLVDIDKDTLEVTIKGIDNDASYGVLRTGLKKFFFPAGSAAQRWFSKTIKSAAQSSGRANRFINTLLKDPGLKFGDGEEVTIDLDKVVNKRLVLGALHFCGLRCTAIPTEIDSELYDKLVALAKDAPDGGADREAYLDSIATRLGAGSEQYQCAVQRLDDAIAHARKLKDEGKVYTAEQWETHDVQKAVAEAANDAATNSASLPNMDSNTAKTLRMKSDYVGNTNFFMRDMFDKVTASGKHTNWFKS